MEYSNFSEEEEKLYRAQKKVKKMKGFYAHLAVYIIINLMLAIMSGMHGGIRGFFEPIKTTGLFWGIGVFFHWYGVFGKDLIFGRNWEERKIRELMDKDKTNSFQ